MAKVLVLTDRDAADPEWKGERIWQIILSLAESQHEVLVATPLTPESLTLTHPRLTITRPISSWRADQIVPLTKQLMSFQPQIIQTFALAPSKLWPSLSVWPYLNAICKVTPGLRRVSTLFDERDCLTQSPSLIWHKSADVVTVFCERHRARVEPRLGRSVQVVPLEHGPLAAMSESPVVLIPAPVSEWTFPETGLRAMVGFSEKHPEAQIHILGGWGDWTSLQRKSGWQCLAPIAARVHLREEIPYDEFVRELATSQALWLEPLAPDSWRFLLSSHLARQMDKPLYLPNRWAPSAVLGSTANSLSRLYLNDASSRG